jgi:hypothetical protein
LAAYADLAKDGDRTGENPRFEKMKNAGKPRKPAKAPTQTGKEQVNPILDIMQNMDEDMLTTLLQSMQTEIGSDPELFGPKDALELFSEYLEGCARGTVDEDDKNELLSDLVEMLAELKVDSNGGDPEARGKIQAVNDLLDNAIEGHSLQVPDLIITGKFLSDAGWVVPDSLKQAMTEALQAPPPGMVGGTGNDLVSSLLEVADQAGQNPFELYEYLSSLLASFPTEASGRLLCELVAGKKTVINQAVAGFVLHPDAVLARLVAEALAASAAKTPVESSLIERLVRIRHWLPESRQGQLDATIRAMRFNALSPAKPELPRVIKGYVSVCDGSGTRSLFVTRRVGAHYQIATVMMKPAGVADAMVVQELSRTAMDDILRQMKSSMLVMETDLVGIARMLGLAIADNFTSGVLPPFKLVEVVESLGLGPIHPDHASPMEIITGLLADLPPEQTNSASVAKAHADVLDSDFAYQWFEAGEALEDLLYPVKGSKQRVAKLMKAYLPERRPFWARQCAISALAMHGDKKAPRSAWKQLALVGRDIVSDIPLDQIPLMKKIAQTSVRAFERRL